MLRISTARGNFKNCYENGLPGKALLPELHVVHQES